MKGLLVYVQEHGGKDLLRAKVIPFGVPAVDFVPEMHAHAHGFFQAIRMAARAKRTLRLVFPETYLHPEDQVKVAAAILKAARVTRVIVGTHSLMMLYALNNGLIRDSKVEVKAFLVKPNGRKKSIMSGRFISEVELGAVASSLSDEFNRLCKKKGRGGS